MGRAWVVVGVLAGLAARLVGQTGIPGPHTPYSPDASPRSATRIVAAADASALERRQADLVCDGVSDEQQIQAAIDAVAGLGGRVVLSRGTFVLGTTGQTQGCIRLASNVHLAGQGAGTTILRLRDAHGSAVAGIVRTAGDAPVRSCSLSDLTIDGNRASNPAAAGSVTGVLCGSAGPPGDEDVRLERVEVRQCNAAGFDLREHATRLRLLDCLAHDNGLDGLVLDGCRDAIVSGCQAWANDRHGFRLAGGSSNVDLLSGIARDNAGSGFRLEDGAQDCALQGGAAHDNGGSGVHLHQTGNVRIVGLLIRGNGQHGLLLQGGQYTQVLGNRILDNGQAAASSYDGLQLTDAAGTPSIRNVIASNTVTGGSHRYGIREEASGQDRNTYTANIATGARTGDLSLLGTNAVLAANQDG